MNPHRILILVFATLLLGSKSTFADIPPLDRLITVDIRNERIDVALKSIAREGKFFFSYSPVIFNEGTLVTFRTPGGGLPVRSVLTHLFKGSIEYKFRGNHVILRRAAVPDPEPKSFILDGYIVDRQTGNRIPQASIYEKTSLASTVSNPYGYFRLKLPAEVPAVQLEVRKKYYYGETVTLAAKKSQSVDIRLVASPLQTASIQTLPVRVRQDTTRPVINIPSTPPVVAVVTDTNPIPAASSSTNKIDWNQAKQELQRSKEQFMSWVLSKRQAIHEANMGGDTLYRDLQVSFVPFIGTNHTLSARVINRVSYNILAGYSLGMTGVEIGGVLNIDQGRASGVQVAGFSNLVGGLSDGVQVAGFVNLDGQGFRGVQAAGFGNTIGGSVTGVQAAGFYNLVLGDLTSSVQVAGFTNMVNGDARGNFQAAGFLNVAGHDMEGFQLAGFGNVVAEQMKGTQLAGFFNVVGNDLTGTQIAGFFNRAGRVSRGRQLGFINISQSSEKAPLGFFSYVKEGYRRLEVSFDELNTANIAFKTGHQRFYNIFTAGVNRMQPNEVRWSAGYGFGRAFDFGRGWMLNTDLIGIYHLPGGGLFEKAGNSQIRFAVALEKKLTRHLALTFGPTANAYYSERIYPKPTIRPVEVPIFDSQLMGDYGRLDSWLGFSVGIRICNH
ncbi:carboxypeptidase-like regulatory domain-containing protein [Tellurirhabdus bombi]|uniref:carboxypeptidase-like regulatory domain-containing protein n=1 Tax=Tellurirhabdus bombi TaxID=2907205 RepID=UPI001F1F3475|nr:carboxypeptidase-like regulatory domain-containing protein [Tellurirhabdus bombi]